MYGGGWSEYGGGGVDDMVCIEIGLLWCWDYVRLGEGGGRREGRWVCIKYGRYVKGERASELLCWYVWGYEKRKAPDSSFLRGFGVSMVCSDKWASSRLFGDNGREEGERETKT